jgi:hypothetical protein
LTLTRVRFGASRRMLYSPGSLALGTALTCTEVVSSVDVARATHAGSR